MEESCIDNDMPTMTMYDSHSSSSSSSSALPYLSLSPFSSICFADILLYIIRFSTLF